jgi:hypothetical protein
MALFRHIPPAPIKDGVSILVAAIITTFLRIRRAPSCS